MSNKLSICLPEDLAKWLEVSHKIDISQGQIIRDQLEKVRNAEDRPFLHLAGTVNGPRHLSVWEGFSRK